MNLIEVGRSRSNSIEVGRTASNSVELEHAEKREYDRENPMNYEEWSKSIELDRTLTPNFAVTGLSQNGREDFRTAGYEGNEVKKIASRQGAVRAVRRALGECFILNFFVTLVTFCSNLNIRVSLDDRLRSPSALRLPRK